jgi:hypothetical protein
VIDLRRLQVRRDEDDGPQPERRRRRRGGAGEVAGRGAGQRVEAERDGPRGGDRHDTVLERERRVPGVVLQPEVAGRQAELGAEPVGAEEGVDRRRGPGRRGIDGQELEVAPDAGLARLDRGAADLRPDRLAVVDDLERPEAGRTDEARADHLGPEAAPTSQADDSRPVSRVKLEVDVGLRGAGLDRRGHHRRRLAALVGRGRLGRHGRLLVGGRAAGLARRVAVPIVAGETGNPSCKRKGSGGSLSRRWLSCPDLAPCRRRRR